jgi:hypothetical protein
MARRNQEFQTLRSEGGLLPPDLLRRVIDPKATLEGVRAEDYGLPQDERINEVVTQSWNRLRKHWAEFRAALGGVPAGDAATGITNDKWTLPLLRELGFGLLPTSAGPEVAGRHYAINRFFGPVPLHLVGAGVSLDRRAAGVRGAAVTNPHGLVQEFLNRSQGHLWAIVSNGLHFRVLRDNQALSRQAFLEFDLETMFAGEVYADFVLLWLTAHATRFAPRDAERADSCWLEKWTKEADEQGTRALGDLRTGVQKALEILGTGFSGHPRNAALRESLRTGGVTPAELHGQLLRIVYRLILLFVAEDRTIDGAPLLHPRDAAESAALARQRYAEHYSTDRLRNLAGQIKGSRHGDLWRQFQIISRALSTDEGSAPVREQLALPVLGSFLWDPESTAALNQAELTNFEFLDALRNLAFTRQGKTLRPVDYRNLGAEELGGVYESLLALTPQVSPDGSGFTFAEFAGNERKTSGSYYTPDSLVQCLLDSALDPVVDEALRGKSGADAERSLLALKVCDPAVGSGHFLVGAAHRLARHLARVRALAQGESEPSPLLYQHALRDVIGRCLYGVDLNPMAAELCRVSLWLEALDPGKPLSFLDHHIRVGNSLLGTAPELTLAGLPDDAFVAVEGDDTRACTVLRQRNRAERAGWGPLFAQQDAETQVQLQTASAALDDVPDDRPEDIQAKELVFRRHENTEEYRRKKHFADAWCSAFMLRKRFSEPGLEASAQGITQGHLNDLASGRALPSDLESENERLAAHYRFFHWHLAFPEVFARGGFDCVVGNPPWDALSPDTKEFFSRYDERVRFESREGQEGIVKRLLEDPVVARAWAENCRDLYAFVHFCKHSGRYQMFAPGNLGKGDFNVYRMFVEAALSLTRQYGRASQFAPEGLYNGANCMAIRSAFYLKCQLSLVYGFENANEVWFTDIDTRMKFCLYAARLGSHTDAFRAAFNIRSVSELADVTAGRYLTIPVRLVKEFSPDALAIMELSNQMDIDVAAKMYRWPALGDASAEGPRRVYMAEVHMGNDRDIFSEDATGVPVYEGRMVDQFDYRAKGYRSGRGRAAVWEDLPFSNPAKSIQPQWYVPRDKVPGKCLLRIEHYRVGFCDVASPTNERTLVAALLPPGVICGDKVPTITFGDAESVWMEALWVAIANSYAMDFIARKKVSLKMSYTVVDSLPFPRLAATDRRVHELVARCLRLSCTGTEMLPLWNRLSADGWMSETSGGTEVGGEREEGARLRIRAEIDAIVAGELFGLTRQELDYVLSTFPTQQRYQEEQYGEFLSRRLIIEAFDRLQPHA